MIQEHISRVLIREDEDCNMLELSFISKKKCLLKTDAWLAVRFRNIVNDESFNQMNGVYSVENRDWIDWFEYQSAWGKREKPLYHFSVISDTEMVEFIVEDKKLVLKQMSHLES